jgi:hypothetical protein
MPENRSVADHSLIPSVLPRRVQGLTVAEVIGGPAKNGWRFGWFSPKAPATSVKSVRPHGCAL